MSKTELIDAKMVDGSHALGLYVKRHAQELKPYLGQGIKINPATAHYLKGDPNKLRVQVTFGDGKKKFLRVTMLEDIDTATRETLHVIARKAPNDMPRVRRGVSVPNHPSLLSASP